MKKSDWLNIRMTDSDPREPHVHPLVEAYINGVPTPRRSLVDLQAAGDLLDPKVQAILHLREAALELTNLEGALHSAEKVYHRSANVDLQLILILFWARALMYKKSGWESFKDQFKLLSKQALSLLSDSTPKAIQAWVLQLQATLAFKEGNIVEYEHTISKEIALARETPHLMGIIAYHGLSLMERGMGAQLESEFGVEPDAFWGQWSAQEIGEAIHKRTVLCHFIDKTLTGDVVTARRILAEVESLPIEIKMYHHVEFTTCRYLVPLLSRATESLLSEPIILDSEDEPAWVTSTRLLLARRPSVALRYARDHAREHQLEGSALIGFSGYSLLRAELAAGNAEAVARQLHTRMERGTRHYLDNLFYARVELLRGDLSKARGYFTQLLYDVKLLHAERRLDFELKLASELSPTALMSLFESPTEGIDTPPVVPAQSTAAGTTSRVGVERIVYASSEMSQLRDHIQNFAAQAPPVLISGETGTGKEVVARALHEAGPRSRYPFLAINCSAISETLIESELFGYKKGAFSGAMTSHRGLFLEAGEGTILLDEIGDISPRLQVALLRVLEVNEVRPVGSAEQFPIRCRIIAATNAVLEDRIAAGLFRKDLLYRLRRLELHIPPLRHRSSDIVALAQYFLDLGRPAGECAMMSASFAAALEQYSWPGNVRELRNVIERVRLLNSDKLSYQRADLNSAMFVVPGSSNPSRASDTSFTESSIGMPIESALSISENERQGQRAIVSPRSSVSAEEIPNYSAESLKQLLGENTSSRRRIQRLKEIFSEVGELRVNETARIFGISRGTAARYLRQLAEGGFIERIEPSASTRTHYYALKKSP